MVAYLRSSPSIFLSFSFTACSSFFASPFESSNLFKSSEEIVLERCPTVTWMPLKICHVESEFLSDTSVQMQTDWDPHIIHKCNRNAVRLKQTCFPGLVLVCLFHQSFYSIILSSPLFLWPLLLSSPFRPRIQRVLRFYKIKIVFNTKEGHVNPLNPKSDQHQISPCNINAL